MAAKTATPSRLKASSISLGYQQRVIARDVSIEIPNAAITSIIGANGCGKSTLLRGLSKLLLPSTGTVTLDGKDLRDYRQRDFAKLVSMLPQSPITPPGVTVADLIARGRHPHQSWLQQWSSAHSTATTHAMEMTGILDLKDREVDQLSGGQRQRVWISMVLAQDTDIILLDEPTTYLDLAHSIEVLDLVSCLNRCHGKTVVMVLHDLNLAARYSDQLVLMKNGEIIATGAPADILTPEYLEEAYGLKSRVITDPCAEGPLVVPELSKHRSH